MTAVDQILRAFDDAWAHRWESLGSVCDDVSDEAAYWQAPCYAADEAESGWPPPGTIAWQVAHVAHCKRHYAAMVRSRKDAEPPPVVPRTPVSGYAAERKALEAAHTEQREAIAAVTDAELDDMACGKMVLAEFLAMTIRHDTWHAAQIAVARRLFRTRPPSTEAG